MRAPIVGAELFVTVMDAAGWMCQCAGVCGNEHKRTGGECRMPDKARGRLLAAPEHPMPDREAVAVSAEQLRAWCQGCWRNLTTAAARTRAHAATEAQDSLF